MRLTGLTLPQLWAAMTTTTFIPLSLWSMRPFSLLRRTRVVLVSRHQSPRHQYFLSLVFVLLNMFPIRPPSIPSSRLQEHRHQSHALLTRHRLAASGPEAVATQLQRRQAAICSQPLLSFAFLVVYMLHHLSHLVCFLCITFPFLSLLSSHKVKSQTLTSCRPNPY